MSVYSEETWISWMDELAANDYVIVDDFISRELYSTIMQFFQQLEEDERLRKAGIGALGEYQVQSAIRGDLVYWLDEQKDLALSPFFELMTELKEKLLRYCYLSLSGAEFHLAKYPAGSFYKRHLDQFNGRNNRVITVLLYLNEKWQPGNGGELKIYRDSGEYLVEPIANRLLLFKSDMLEHEVLTTQVPRYSLTGWLLRQPEGLGYLLG